MTRRVLKSLLLSAALPIVVLALSQSAQATDRFDVYVELVSFKSLVDMDPSNAQDEYYLALHADVSGEGRRSIRNVSLNGAPKRILPVRRTVVFRNIKAPHRDDRGISLYSDVSEQDVVKVGTIFKPETETRYADMGTARGLTREDLFRKADRSRDDRASETVTLVSRKYRMEVRVTVVEVD